jgi:putative oxidoreductase
MTRKQSEHRSGSAGVRAQTGTAPGAVRWRAFAAAVVGTRTRGTGPILLAGARWVAAIIFVSFGAAKFANHGAELASFRHYPLPAPGLFVYLAGVVEVAGGVLLAAGLVTRLAAVALAGDMIGAIVVSGLARGEVISLTLAPMLLVAMIILIRSGGGRWSVDNRIAAHLNRAEQARPSAR